MARRIESVDILRGFTIAAMILVNTPGTWSHIYAPLRHAKWHGLTPTDLVFPFFLFIVGISIYFAYQNKPNSISTYKKILIRSLKLIVLGLIINWFVPYFPFIGDWENLRIPGVLQRIGIVFMVAAMLFLNFNWKAILGIAIAILIVYWLVLGFIPLPDDSMPTFDRSPNNWAMYIDQKIIGKHMWQTDFDPEGLFSTLPSIASSLFGVLVGKLLSKINNQIHLLFGVSALFLVSGYFFSIWFPINKNIWSSSFVLVTCGWGSLILAIIYWFTDIEKIKIGSIFKYAGMNAITVYFLSSFIASTFYLTNIGDGNVHSWLYESLFNHSFLSAEFSSLLYALVVVGFYLGLAYVMYRKKIFIKV